MMAGIFLIFALAIVSIYLKKHQLAMGLIGLGIVSSIVAFWLHCTSSLDINL